MRAPSPGRKCRMEEGTPARCRSLTASWATSGVCSATGHNRIAGSQSGGNLPGENGEWKIPRRNAGKHAAMQGEFIAFACWPRQAHHARNSARACAA